MNPAELKGSLEAIIYAADEPATLDRLANATETDKEQVRAVLDEMIAAFAADERGVELRRVARGYKFSTKPQHHEVVRKFIKSLRPPVRLSMPALETLAVIAYKQPITLPEIQEIRGVNCSGVIQTLLEKHLVNTAGRKPVIGRPILYRTTKEFLVRFGLNDVDELPSLKEFEQLAREALGPDAGIEIVPESEAGEAAPEGMETAGAESAPAESPAEAEAAEAIATDAETPEQPTADATEEAAEPQQEIGEAEISAAAEDASRQTDSPEGKNSVEPAAAEAPAVESAPETVPETIEEPPAAEPEAAPAPDPEPKSPEPEPEPVAPQPAGKPEQEREQEREAPGERSPSS
jgi:segregation and condensation protein B